MTRDPSVATGECSEVALGAQDSLNESHDRSFMQVPDDLDKVGCASVDLGKGRRCSLCTPFSSRWHGESSIGRETKGR